MIELCTDYEGRELLPGEPYILTNDDYDAVGLCIGLEKGAIGDYMHRFFGDYGYLKLKEIWYPVTTQDYFDFLEQITGEYIIVICNEDGTINDQSKSIAHWDEYVAQN